MSEATCKPCGRTFTGSRSATNLTNHLKGKSHKSKVKVKAKAKKKKTAPTSNGLSAVDLLAQLKAKRDDLKEDVEKTAAYAMTMDGLIFEIERFIDQEAK